MPVPLLKTLAAAADPPVSIAAMEERWERAKEIVSREHKLKRDDPRYWQLVVGIVKRMSGIKDRQTFKEYVDRTDEQWDDSGAADAEGRWADYRDGRLSAVKMAKWLLASRIHKKNLDDKMKSARGAIAQQQNTSKLITADQADRLRAALDAEAERTRKR